MIVLFRFTDVDGFADSARECLGEFARRPGFLRGWLGRAADDPQLWVVGTEWSGAGAYRRALSAVAGDVTGFLSTAWNEPTAFEVVGPALGPG